MDNFAFEYLQENKTTMSEEFKWTDELVKEFANNVYVDWLADDDKVRKFIESKQQKQKDWEIVEYNFGDGFDIHSVKRLSDGEVFSVGDKVADRAGDRYTNKSIQSFFVHHNEQMAVVFNDDKGFYPFVHIAKVEKKKLFTTEDGKEIFEGGECWIVNTEESEFANPFTPYKWTDVVKMDKGSEKYFSTEEAAKEYVLMNMPCLSLKEVVDFAEWCDGVEMLQDSLKHHVEQKINK